MVKLVLTTTITLIVGAVVGAMIEASKGWASHWVGAKKAERKRLRDGDHIAIDSGIGVGLDSGSSSSFRAGVEVAPSVSLGLGVVLDSREVADWVDGWRPGLTSHREYHDPELLIRYVEDETRVAINATGLVSLLVPIGHHTTGEDLHKTHRLDVSSLIRSIVPLVVAITDGGFDRLYPGHLLTPRLDWRFSVSRYINGEAGSTPWSGLDFLGRSPEQETQGQLPPAAGNHGFGGLALRNIEASALPASIVMIVLRSFIERSGNSGLDACFADLRVEVDDAVVRVRAT